MPRPLRAPLCCLALIAFLFACEKEVLEANPERYVGIGVELTMEAAGARVVRVIDEGPAAQAGLQPNDVVLEIEGAPARGRGLADVVNAVRGTPGSSLQLLVRTSDGNKEITVTRQAIDNR